MSRFRLMISTVLALAAILVTTVPVTAGRGGGHGGGGRGFGGGFRGVGFRGVGFRGVGFRGVGFRGVGFRGFGFRGFGFRNGFLFGGFNPGFGFGFGGSFPAFYDYGGYDGFGYGGYCPGYLSYGPPSMGYVATLGTVPAYASYASSPGFPDYYARAASLTAPSLAGSQDLGYTDYYTGAAATAPAVVASPRPGYTDYYASAVRETPRAMVSKRSGYTDYYASAAASAQPVKSPLAETLPSPNPVGAARILVRLPADAVLWLDGKPTTQTGAERSIPLANVKQGKTCEVKARWVQDGRTVEHTLRAEVRANQTTTLDFRGTKGRVTVVSTEKPGAVR